MPRACTVCAHESRERIDKAIVSGKSNRTIASQFRLTRAAVQRHKKHVATALVSAATRRNETLGTTCSPKCRV